MKNCIVLGVGLIGQQFIRMLSGHPEFKLKAVIASKESNAKSLVSKWALPNFSIPNEFSEMKLTSYECLDLNSIDIAFSALPSSVAREMEEDLANKGIKVFSNSSALRYDLQVPILIPEVNAEHIKVIKSQKYYKNNCGFIITSSNCSVSGLSIIINELNNISPIKNVFVSTYQALSGAGFKAIKSPFPTSVVPFIENEEEKIELELRKILGTLNSTNSKIIIGESIENILASCARVPIIEGHLESVTVEFNHAPTKQTIINSLESLRNPFSKLHSAPAQFIKLIHEIDRPQSTLDLYGEKGHSSGMSVIVGRLRLTGSFLRCFLLIHNTIRGGAGGSILNAELASNMGYL